MHVISRKMLSEFWAVHPDSEQHLKSWFKEADSSVWATPSDIKEKYSTASFLGNNRVVFNICGNKYRLIAFVKYEFRTVFIRFVGTHAEYDRIKEVEKI